VAYAAAAVMPGRARLRGERHLQAATVICFKVHITERHVPMYMTSASNARHMWYERCRVVGTFQLLVHLACRCRPDRWCIARSVVSGRLINGYSVNDWTLGLLYRVHRYGLGHAACTIWHAKCVCKSCLGGVKIHRPARKHGWTVCFPKCAAGSVVVCAQHGMSVL
jgi:hypothetical protein